MNTKLIMSANAILLGTLGVAFTFAPDWILENFAIAQTPALLLILQLLGALYVSFAMLNWMVKHSLIGGIYNKPIALANFAHFMIGGLALIKETLSSTELPIAITIIALIYLVFGILHGLILFRHPLKSQEV